MGSTQRPLRDNSHHSQKTDINPSGRIRPPNPSKRAAAHPHLRTRGHWDRPLYIITNFFWELNAEHCSYEIMSSGTNLSHLHMACHILRPSSLTIFMLSSHLRLVFSIRFPKSSLGTIFHLNIVSSVRAVSSAHRDLSFHCHK
jgi:hypothetical protein